MVHCFEESGLGVAPYKYLYCEDMGKCATSCQYCCTGIRYKHWLLSTDGKEFFVGSDCIYKSGDAGLIDIVKRAKNEKAREARRAKREAKYKAMREAYEVKQADRRLEWLNNHPGCFEVLEWAETQTGISKNIYDSFAQWGNLSEKQVDFLKSLYEKSKNPVKAEVPVGRVEVEGTVLSTKWDENGFYGATMKMTVESNEGYRVFGTVPSCIRNIDKGDKVRFTAALTQSNNDPAFGFFSRPKNAEVLHA